MLTIYNIQYIVYTIITTTITKKEVSTREPLLLHCNVITFSFYITFSKKFGGC